MPCVSMKLTCTKPLKHSRPGDSRDWRHPVHGTTCTCHHCTCVCSLAKYVSPNSIDNTFLTYTSKYNTKYNTRSHTNTCARVCTRTHAIHLRAGGLFTPKRWSARDDSKSRWANWSNYALCTLHFAVLTANALSLALSFWRALSPPLSLSFAFIRPLPTLSPFSFSWFALCVSSLVFSPFLPPQPCPFWRQPSPSTHATHCSTATHCNIQIAWQNSQTIKNTATHCHALQHIATHHKHCNTLRHTATYCSTL